MPASYLTPRNVTSLISPLTRSGLAAHQVHTCTLSRHLPLTLTVHSPIMRIACPKTRVPRAPVWKEAPATVSLDEALRHTRDHQNSHCVGRLGLTLHQPKGLIISANIHGAIKAKFLSLSQSPEALTVSDPVLG